MKTQAKIYIGMVIMAGALSTAVAVLNWSTPDPLRFGLYLILTAAASLVKLRLPGITGTYSLNSVFLILGVVFFTLPETVLAAVAAMTLQQAFRITKRPALVQFLFNNASEAASVALSSLVADQLLYGPIHVSRSAVLALVAAMYFVVNTVMVSGVLSLLQGKALRDVMREWYYWPFPYYLLGVTLVGLLPGRDHQLNTEAWIVLFPVAYLLHFFCGLALQPRTETMERGGGAVAIPQRAKVFITCVIVTAAAIPALTVWKWEVADPFRFLSYLILAALAAGWKVRLPGMKGTITLHYVIALFAVVEMSFSEAVVISACAALVQSLWKPKQLPGALQVAFNISNSTLSTALAFVVCRLVQSPSHQATLVFCVAGAGLAYYAINSTLLAVVLCLVEGKSLTALWQSCHFWVFPYYLVGVAGAGLMITADRSAGWLYPLLVVPVLALVCTSYRLHVQRPVEAAPV